MKLVSWNIRGLEDPGRKCIIKMHHNSIKHMDFLMLQEIKTTDFNLEIFLDFIWKDALKIFTNHPKGKGGIALMINNKWNNALTHKGISPCKREVWATFNHNSCHFGVCYVHAPNDYKGKIELWNYLDSLCDIPSIIAGDFNMVERCEDKNGGNPFEWRIQEKPHWDILVHHKGLFDPLAGNQKSHSGPWFTWCNSQQGGNIIYSRLDRIYANKDFFSFVLTDSGNHLNVLPSTISDHHPIFALINHSASPPPPPHPCYKFLLNISLLKDSMIPAAIKMIRFLNLHNNNLASPIVRRNFNLHAW